MGTTIGEIEQKVLENMKDEPGTITMMGNGLGIKERLVRLKKLTPDEGCGGTTGGWGNSGGACNSVNSGWGNSSS